MAKNIEKEALFAELHKHLDNISHSVELSKDYESCVSIMEKLDESIVVQQNSAQFMNFIIQDLLDFAQIKSGKFRQNFKTFNIVDTVQKVMCIQR